MVSHYGIPMPPPLARGPSRVSHKLQLSQQERINLHLTLFALFVSSALFVACFTSLLLLVNFVPPPEGFPASRDGYYSRGASGFEKLASAPLSTTWAYYSPYHPAGKFEGSTRGGCVVSQVNIVSLLASIDLPQSTPYRDHLTP